MSFGTNFWENNNVFRRNASFKPGQIFLFFSLIIGNLCCVCALPCVCPYTVGVFFFSMFSQPALNSPQGLLVNS